MIAAVRGHIGAAELETETDFLKQIFETTAAFLFWRHSIVKL
jgi:hypothetical protein